LPASHYKGQEKEELNNDKEDEEDNEGEEWENRFSFSSPIVSIFFIVVSLFFKGQEERRSTTIGTMRTMQKESKRKVYFYSLPSS
jgi:hypothetical protein